MKKTKKTGLHIGSTCPSCGYYQISPGAVIDFDPRGAIIQCCTECDLKYSVSLKNLKQMIAELRQGIYLSQHLRKESNEKIISLQ